MRLNILRIYERLDELGDIIDVFEAVGCGVRGKPAFKGKLNSSSHHGLMMVFLPLLLIYCHLDQLESKLE